MRTLLTAIAGLALIAVAATVKQRHEADSEVLAMMKAKKNLHPGPGPGRKPRARG